MNDDKKEKVPRKKLPMTTLKRWVFDWIEGKKYPPFVKGCDLADAIIDSHEVSEYMGKHGLTVLIGKLLTHPKDLGYERYSHGKNGFTYALSKVISRAEFDKEMGSVSPLPVLRTRKRGYKPQ